MKIRSLHRLLTLCLFALLAARAGALTIVQTATVPLVKDLDPQVIDGMWDFDPFAPAGGGTLTAASLQTTLNLAIAAPFGTFTSWSTSVTMGSGEGFYTEVVLGSGFFGNTSATTSFDHAFTPSQLANFLVPAQTELWIGSSVFAFGGDPFGVPFVTTISGNATFVLTYEYETSSANVPEAGSTGLFLGGALACSWIGTRRRAFLAH